MQTYIGADVQLHTFLTLILDGGKQSVSHPTCFTPGKRVPSTHCVGDWEDPRAGVDMVALPLLEIKPCSTKPHHSHYTDSYHG